MEILFLLASGAVAGMFAGLLGIGGGIIIVPVLAMVFTSQGISIDVLMHVSIGTSLATIVITSLSSIRAHQKHKAIDWSVVRVITIGLFVGGLIGAAIAKLIPGKDLKLIFSIFMFLIAAQMYFGNTAKPHRTLPNKLGMILAGTSIGTIASLMGVGGGSMSVPFFTWCNMSIRNAVATSSAVGFRVAVKANSGKEVNFLPFLTARLIQDEIGLDYLKGHCPDEKFPPANCSRHCRNRMIPCD